MRKSAIAAIAATPSLLLLTLALLFDAGVFENLVLVGRYRIDAVGILSRLAVVLAGGMGFVLLIFWSADRRAQRTLEREKARIEASRRGFFRRLDHELKNPVTVLRIGLANLRHSPNLAPAETASVRRLGQQVDRLQKLVQDLRWLSELEAQPLERHPVNLADVLQEAAELAQNAYPGRAIDLNIQQVPWPVAPVAGDRDLLMLALRNLIDNALKYSSADDRVEVRATDDGQWATVEVADTGVGIPSEQLPRIFEELYRADNAQGVPGSGLGLALVWRILKLHDGRIDVRSREGQGTVMRVRLPAARES